MRGQQMAGLAALTLVAMGAAAVPAAADGAGSPRLGSNQVLFESLRTDNDELYLVDSDGSGERRLTDAPGQDAAPVASPDRRTIAFASEREGLMQIYLMNADGSNQHNIGNSDSFDFHPAWYDGGRRILFQRLSPTSGFDLWTMAADGSDQQRLTSLPRNEVGGFVSPDGQTVAFLSNNGASQDVWTVPLAGGQPTNLTAGVCVAGTNPCVLAFDRMPGWTPDGRLLFVSNRSGVNGIWTSHADGSDARLLLDLGSATVATPASSAHGHWVVFVSSLDNPGSAANVYKVKSDGTELTRLTFAGNDLAPQFAAMP